MSDLSVQRTNLLTFSPTHLYSTVCKEQTFITQTFLISMRSSYMMQYYFPLLSKYFYITVSQICTFISLRDSKS